MTPNVLGLKQEDALAGCNRAGIAAECVELPPERFAGREELLEARVVKQQLQPDGGMVLYLARFQTVAAAPGQ